MLATGLSALYSSLPRKIEVPGDDWHCLRREDWLGVPALALFMSSLEFCNAVIQVGLGFPGGLVFGHSGEIRGKWAYSLEFCYSAILGVVCLFVPFYSLPYSGHLTFLLPLSLTPLQVAHPLVQKQLVDYIHNGFLVPVMGPALHKVRVMGGKANQGIRLRGGDLNARTNRGGSGQGTPLFIHVCSCFLRRTQGKH